MVPAYLMRFPILSTVGLPPATKLFPLLSMSPLAQPRTPLKHSTVLQTHRTQQWASSVLRLTNLWLAKVRSRRTHKALAESNYRTRHVCLSVSVLVRMEQYGSHRTHFREISYANFLIRFSTYSDARLNRKQYRSQRTDFTAETYYALYDLTL